MNGEPDPVKNADEAESQTYPVTMDYMAFIRGGEVAQYTIKKRVRPKAIEELTRPAFFGFRYGKPSTDSRPWQLLRGELALGSYPTEREAIEAIPPGRTYVFTDNRVVD